MAARAWTLTIPAPAGWLNANQRTDRRAQTSDRRAWRLAALVYARKARLPYLHRAHILAVLHFDTNIRRDVHNYAPTLKAVIDGLVDYGLLPDDSDNYLIGPDLRRGAPVKRARYGPAGQVVLTISDMAGEVATHA